MKKRILFLGVLLVSALALAVGPYNKDQIGRWIQGPLYVMPPSLAAGVTTTNAVTRMLAGSESMNFGEVTITCADSTGHTVTGAQIGDPCFVGVPADATDAGYVNVTLSCYVSAANTVKVRACAAGTAVNLSPLTYTTRIISNQ